MTPFYFSEIEENIALILGDEARHCVKVMRFKRGDEWIGIDGKGMMYVGKIIDLRKGEVELKILKRESEWGEKPLQIKIACSPLRKPDRFEWMVEKAVELGATSIQPYLGKRTVKTGLRLDRLKRIMIAAMKQSMRSRLPELFPPVDFEEILQQGKNSLCFIATASSDKTLDDYRELLPGQDSICLLIGPEGDFDENELSSALDAGFKPVSLGNNRLRTETAAIHLLSIIKFLQQY